MKSKTYRYITRMASGSGRYTTQASPQGKVNTAEVIADMLCPEPKTVTIKVPDAPKKKPK